jgi:hypothetical protein
MSAPPGPRDADRLPECAYPHFWDIDPSTLDVSQHPQYVIERLLDYGDFPELHWMFQRFSREEITSVLKHSRGLSLRSANFWSKTLGIPKGQVKCLSKRFQQTHNRIWQR